MLTSYVDFIRDVLFRAREQQMTDTFLCKGIQTLAGKYHVTVAQAVHAGLGDHGVNFDR